MKPTFKGHQKSLFIHENTKEEMAIVGEMIKLPNQCFTTYLCQKHGKTFIRHKELKYGYCWECKKDISPIDILIIEDINGKQMIKIYPMQNYHTSDIKLISEFEKEKGEEIMAWEEHKGMEMVEWETKGQEIIGKLIEIKTDIGENQSNIYVIEKEDGKKIGIWESGFLKIPMSDVKVGNKIKIIYEGLGKPKQKGFNPPRLFKVFVDK